MSAVTLDFSKAQPLPAAPVTLDFSKAVPIGTDVNTNPDTRNGLQRVLDASVQPEHPLDKGIAGQLESAYYGVPQGIEGVVAHPLKTAQAVGQSIMHPINSAIQLGKNFIDNPTLTVGQALGASAAMAPIAELAGPAIDAAGKVAGRAALLGKTPEAAYQSALKPSTALASARPGSPCADRPTAGYSSFQNRDCKAV